MRSVSRIIIARMIRSSIGRWTLTIVLFLIGVISLLAYPTVSQTESATDGLTAFVTGILFTGLGLAMLVATIRIGRARRRFKRAQQQGVKRANELQTSGLLLPIPALPQLPQSVSPDDAAVVEGYAERMAKVPWGDDSLVSATDAPALFDRTVARVRGVRGDWSQLKDPINIFAGLPRPLCFVGAAEVMLRLSYVGGTTFVPAGLRQGLRFIARSQFTEPVQPDALVIRTKLLASSFSKAWLELADQTLERLRRVAPQHPRLPDAEATVHLRRGEYDAAIACFDQLIAHPPSVDEAFAARANRAAALESLKRHEEALDAYREALRFAPEDPWMLNNIAIILLNQGQLDEAREANARALANMNFAEAHTIRARILAALAARGGTTTDTTTDTPHPG